MLTVFGAKGISARIERRLCVPSKTLTTTTDATYTLPVVTDQLVLDRLRAYLERCDGRVRRDWASEQELDEWVMPVAAASGDGLPVAAASGDGLPAAVVAAASGDADGKDSSGDRDTVMTTTAASDVARKADH